MVLVFVVFILRFKRFMLCCVMFRALCWMRMVDVLYGLVLKVQGLGCLLSRVCCFMFWVLGFDG